MAFNSGRKNVHNIPAISKGCPVVHGKTRWLHGNVTTLIKKDTFESCFMPIHYKKAPIILNMVSLPVRIEGSIMAIVCLVNRQYWYVTRSLKWWIELPETDQLSWSRWKREDSTLQSGQLFLSRMSFVQEAAPLFQRCSSPDIHQPSGFLGRDFIIQRTKHTFYLWGEVTDY